VNVGTLYRATAGLQRRIVPGLEYSQDQFERDLRTAAHRAERWLDLGCGHQLLSAWRDDAEREIVGSCGFVVGTDYDMDSLQRHRSIRLRCRSDARALPFGDASFDLVTANMVVEHLDDPGTQFREIARVLRPGGTFLFHTPNARSYIVGIARLLPERLKKTLVWILERRAEEDVFPTFYRANTPEAIAAWAATSGFVVDEVRPILSSPALSVVPPLAALELVWIRAMRGDRLARYRPDLVCRLRRVGDREATAARPAA
jgi:ubiquinone/menaquinone biosynthesis C-methylase UbiE